MEGENRNFPFGEKCSMMGLQRTRGHALHKEEPI